MIVDHTCAANSAKLPLLEFIVEGTVSGSVELVDDLRFLASSFIC